jgi:predicted XRE-type DNA-binding protein
MLKTRVNKYGYEVVGLGKFKKHFSVHRLVAMAFIPNSLNKPCVNHINGIKTDNRVENLEWCTYWENDNHARQTGLSVCNLQGENSSNVKLTNEIVIKIREMHNSNKYSQREIGRILNIEYKNINQVVLRKRWKHIIIVAGNHEYYTSGVKVEIVNNLISNQCESMGIDFLNKD